MQVLIPEVPANLPIGQLLQRLAPRKDVKVPGLHCLQTVEPVTGANCPGEQVSH